LIFVYLRGPRALWRSVRIGTNIPLEMKNILEGGAMSGEVLSAHSLSVDIPSHAYQIAKIKLVLLLNLISIYDNY
jgi:hypothetical protein